MNPQLSALKQHMSMILLFRQVRVQARRVEVSVGLHSRVSRFRGQDPLPCSLSGVGRIHVFSGWWPSVPSHGALSGTAGRFSTASPPGKCMCAGARARRYVRVRMRALRCLVRRCACVQVPVDGVESPMVEVASHHFCRFLSIGASQWVRGHRRGERRPGGGGTPGCPPPRRKPGRAPPP